MSNKPLVKAAQKRRKKNLPLDLDLSLRRNEIVSRLGQSRSDALAKLQQINRGYVTTSRGIEEQQPIIMRNVLNNAAGRGMAYSSGYAQNVGNAQRDYAGKLGDLTNQRGSAVAAIKTALQQENTNQRYNLNTLLLSQVKRDIAAAARRRNARAPRT